MGKNYNKFRQYVRRWEYAYNLESCSLGFVNDGNHTVALESPEDSPKDHFRRVRHYSRDYPERIRVYSYVGRAEAERLAREAIALHERIGLEFNVDYYPGIDYTPDAEEPEVEDALDD